MNRQPFKVEFVRLPDVDYTVAEKAADSCFETIFPGTDNQWFVRLYANDQDVYEAFVNWCKSGKRGSVMVTSFSANGEVCIERVFDVIAKTIGPALLSLREGFSSAEYEVEFELIKDQS